MSEEIKIITLGDIFKNIETEEKAFKFKDYIRDLQQKVGRLNNIINELEKWIEEHKQYQLISERYIVWEDKLVNKLKELKEGDKE